MSSNTQSKASYVVVHWKVTVVGMDKDHEWTEELYEIIDHDEFNVPFRTEKVVEKVTRSLNRQLFKRLDNFGGGDEA
jgi:hypothetical protein